MQATETASVERDNALKAKQDALNATKATRRQLDRANQALAESINNDLGLDPNKSLTPRQRQALWKLAVADEPIKRDFVSILDSSPQETRRVSPGLAWISRALGLLNASRALDPVLKQISRAPDPDALEAWAQALKALPVRLTEAQSSQALDPVLKQLGQTTDPRALEALAQALQALAPKLTEAQASQALDPVLKQIDQTTGLDAQLLAQAFQALASKVSEAQASRALDPLLKQLGQTTEPMAIEPLARALQALPIKLSDAQASQALHALDLVFKQLDQTTSINSIAPLARAFQALAAKLSEAQASQALDFVLKQLSQTTNSDVLGATPSGWGRPAPPSAPATWHGLSLALRDLRLKRRRRVTRVTVPARLLCSLFNHRFH